MTDYGYVGISQFVWMGLGTVIFIVIPIVLAIVWKIKKKEPITTILIGAATFLLFALILEKPIQNILVFPTLMGLPDQPISIFLNTHPILLALVTALFPGVFEETGRLVAYKTVLKKRTQKETSISYGIGHGGIEVVFLLGLTFSQYIMYAVMINTGAFQMIVDQVAAQAPDQLSQVETIVDTLTTFSFMTLLINIVERIFAVMFHIGASVIVFYACRDKKRFWLYPLAIVLHTAMDFVAALVIFEVISLSSWGLEAFAAVFGLAVFFGAYFLLYKKDK